MECMVKGIKLYYEEVGEGRPLLMLHGWPLDHRHMVNDMEPLFKNRLGWRRIYPDFPGMGKTLAPDWITCQDQMLDIIIEFIQTIAPSERIVAAGTSYGGYIARGLVNKLGHKMDGLMINVPAITKNKQKLSLPSHKILRENKEFLAALQPDEQNLVEITVKQSLELLQGFRAGISPAEAIADHNFLFKLRQNWEFTFDVDVLTDPFPAPSLILTGRHDKWCGYREAYQILDNYPRGTYTVLDYAGHNLSLEQQSLFRALAGEWLDRVEDYLNKESSLGKMGS